MKPFLTIIKSDYLQRTRSYSFLITLCASLAIAYTFVPEPNASYSTIRIADHVGYYNSAWFGYVTAIMTSIFLSLIGFYLVNSGIKKDIETKVGQIVAATPISNFKYLCAKVLSNFLVLLSIVLIVFVMSLVLFMLYNDGYPLELVQFIKPYTFITLPAMFFIAVIAVVFEVFLGKFSILQNIGFFFLYTTLMVSTPSNESYFSLDVFGSKIVMHQLEGQVRVLTKKDKSTDLSIGYVIGNTNDTKRFLFKGMDFPRSFIMSRFLLFAIGIGFITLISPFFHRFNVKERNAKKKLTPSIQTQLITPEIRLTKLPIPQINYSVWPIFKTEFKLLVRKGKRWVWFFNLIGMLLLALLPLKIAHQMVLPILWFLQVGRLSDLTTKEAANRVHYFVFSSYKPLSRLFVSKVFAAIMLMICLALPLIIRQGLLANVFAIITILLGSIFIVVFAVFLGMVSKGKKLFEVLFFMITYANMNSIPFADYFGGLEHQTSYFTGLLILVMVLGGLSVFLRTYELKK